MNTAYLPHSFIILFRNDFVKVMLEKIEFSFVDRKSTVLPLDDSTKKKTTKAVEVRHGEQSIMHEVFGYLINLEMGIYFVNIVEENSSSLVLYPRHSIEQPSQW